MSTLKQMQQNAHEAADQLKTLAHPARLLILCLLSEGEHSVSDLLAYTDLSQSAFSQHLSVLKAKQLVQYRKEAQVVYYSLKDEDVKKILAVLYELYCSG